MRFILSDSRYSHLARHFTLNGDAGSHFNLKTFPSSKELIEYINSHVPEVEEYQTRGRSIFHFQLKDGRTAGTVGIMKRSQLRQDDIVRLMRDGVLIDIGLVDELAETREFCVIADATAEGLSIITAFPGSCSRPFPHKNQSKAEYELNHQFWEEHVLLKKR